MLLTEDQRLLIKTTESESRAYLSIYKPTVLFACRVNMATPKVGDTEITFDTVTTGAYTDVFKWATVFIGTAAGKNDVSTIWARSCTATKLTVGMNSIDWKDNLYITVLNFVDMWNRPFSFYLSGDQIVYEIDGDTAFAAVDEGLGTFVNVGGNQAVFTGGKVYWDASESLNVSGDSVTYTWVFEGGTPSTYSGETPGDVTYNTPGHYKTKVVATSSSGYVNIGYRYVSVYDRFGVNSPKTLVISNDFSGSREEGGWVANVLIGQDSLADVQIGYPAVVFAEHNFGGQDSDLFKILFSGYVVGKSGTYDFVSKTAEFMLGTGNERMLLRPMTSISVDSSSSASGWHEITEMTVKKFLYYYLNYFTTALACFDIRVGSGFDTPVRYFETDINSIYENVFDIVNKSRGGLPVFDRQGTMWVELGADILDSFCSTVPTTFALEDADFLGDVNIEESNPNMGNLQIGGFAGDTPLLSESPNTNYVYYTGGNSNKQGFAVDDQEELNTICGNIYAHANAKYKHVDISLFGIYLNFDIAPMVCIPVSISEDKNNLGISWNKKSFYCTEATLEFSPDSLSILYSISLHEITQGFAGETLIIPQPVEENIDPGVDSGEFPIFPEPNISFPPFLPEPPKPVPYCLFSQSGPFRIIFDKARIISNGTLEESYATAYYPCQLHAHVAHPSTLTLNCKIYDLSGGTPQTTSNLEGLSVYALDAGGNILLSASYIEWTGQAHDYLRIVFYPQNPIDVHSFRIQVEHHDSEWYLGTPVRTMTIGHEYEQRDGVVGVGAIFTATYNGSGIHIGWVSVVTYDYYLRQNPDSYLGFSTEGAQQLGNIPNIGLGTGTLLLMNTIGFIINSQDRTVHYAAIRALFPDISLYGAGVSVYNSYKITSDHKAGWTADFVNYPVMFGDTPPKRLDIERAYLLNICPVGYTGE